MGQKTWRRHPAAENCGATPQVLFTGSTHADDHFRLHSSVDESDKLSRFDRFGADFTNGLL